MATRRSLHSPEYKIFLRVLRSAREDAGLSQSVLAGRMGQLQTFISKCERGDRRVDVIEMRQICKALKLDFGSFIKTLDAALKAPRR